MNPFDLLYLSIMAIFGLGFIISIYFTREDHRSINHRVDDCLPTDQKSKIFKNIYNEKEKAPSVASKHEAVS